MLANLCLLLVSCLVGVSLCEVSLRVFSPKYRHLAEAQFSRDPIRLWRRANNRDEILHPDTGALHAVHHNNFTSRQHRDFSEADLAAATNIGVFGDSFVENIRMEAPYSFTEPLDYLLNQSRKRFNVLNFGVEGYGTDLSFLRYEYFPYAENLDYVFYVYCSNDLENIYDTGLFYLDDTGHLARHEVIRSSWWSPLITRFHISYLIVETARRLSASIEERAVNEKPRITPRPTSEPQKNSTEIFRQLIRRWKSQVEAGGGTFYVVTLPDRPVVRPGLASIFREDGVEVVNLYDCFGEHDPAHLSLTWATSPYRFRKDGHWNEAGNQLAAVCLYRFLEKKAGLSTLSEDGLREALYRYYSAFDGWRPTNLWGGGTPGRSPAFGSHTRRLASATSVVNSVVKHDGEPDSVNSVVKHDGEPDSVNSVVKHDGKPGWRLSTNGSSKPISTCTWTGKISSTSRMSVARPIWERRSSYR